MIQVRYSKAFRPPAPVVDVLLRHPDRASAGYEVEAQLDTGAGRTVIPLDAAVALNLLQLGCRSVGVAGGGVVTFGIYEVAISIPSVMDFVLEVAAGDEPRVLLGRDVLNCLYATLSGPTRVLDLSDQPLPTPATP